MKLNEQEFRVLGRIEEQGISDSSQLKIFTKLKIRDIKAIMDRLEKLGLITIERKYDKYYQEDYWNATTTKKGKTYYESHLKEFQ